MRYTYHIHDLGHGGPPNNGVVYQEHILALEDCWHRIQLSPDAQLPSPAGSPLPNLESASNKLLWQCVCHWESLQEQRTAP